MKIFIIFICTILLSIAGKTQDAKPKSHLADKYNEPNGNFLTTGDQEKYLAAKLFDEEYLPQNFERFKGNLQLVNNRTIRYDDIIVEIDNTSTTIKTIFEKGIVYPQIIPANTRFLNTPNANTPDSVTITPTQIPDHALVETDTLRITDVEELLFLNPSPQVKRFKFWLFVKGFANPNVYFIELTNSKATTKTDLQTFINGSKLTFFKYGWLII